MEHCLPIDGIEGIISVNLKDSFGFILLVKVIYCMNDCFWPCFLARAYNEWSWYIFYIFFVMYITIFLAIQSRTSSTPIGHAPGFLFSGIDWLGVKASKLFSVSEFERLCLYCITVLRNLLWMLEVLRDWSHIYWKPRFCPIISIKSRWATPFFVF